MKELTLLCKQVLVCFSRLVVQAILEVEDKNQSFQKSCSEIFLVLRITYGVFRNKTFCKDLAEVGNSR